MRRLSYGITALCLLSLAAAGSARASERLPEARALEQKLLDSGFTCKTSDAGFATCLSPGDKDLIGYPQPFAVIVPPRFLPGGRLVLHLHGWLENKPFDRTPQAILDYFDFSSLLEQSGVPDALFVLPFSQGKCQTYKDRLADSFEAFVGGVLGFLKVPAPARITLSGHSGAWTPIETILEDAYKGDALNHVFGSRIDSVFLFDATNSGRFIDSTDGFKRFARAWALQPQPRVSAVYRKDTFTQLGARRLARELGPVFRKVELPENSDHWGTVKAAFPTFLRELKN